jgi:mRNA interferase RelE/StbE
VTYQIVIARSARRELERLPKQVARRLLSRIDSLQQNPRPPGSIKRIGSDDLWRVRSGDYRIVYRVNDSTRVVDVLVVRHRRDAYE